MVMTYLQFERTGMTKRDEINAFLGKNTEFEGRLSFEGAVRIDGRFKGEISSDGTLIVGETAVIESEIKVSHIIISGEMRGNILASRKIEIHAPGKVFGNICAPAVVMDEGVVFEGTCTMQTELSPKDESVGEVK
jgi:cytoskeletal protein CcmA (bactofilin family)